MKTKNISIILIFWVFVLSCSKDEVTKYRGVDYVYYEDEVNAEGEYPSKYFTFLFEDESTEEKIIEIPVLVSGEMSDKDRVFSVEIVDTLTTAVEGTHFVIDPDIQLITNQSPGGNLIVNILRTPDMKDTEYTVGLKITSNDNFTSSFSQVYTLRFSDFLAQPDWWYPWTKYAGVSGTYPYIGEFTVTKCLLWMEYNDVMDGTNPIGEHISRFNTYVGEWQYNDATVFAIMYGFGKWLESHPDAPIYDENGDLVVNTLN
ncbi:DUF4843 domain-containing protein [Saccharicrinis fermentans]|uniref:DUF4843 domain-containing protein n=1 Tax=Saccharicrinis fermentans DSM 9555 = JCM 21142 TaxID=869213 RepID=W7YCL1_9BACT|nr:DUF4843 domain-containing protein [Saccharicrinis fermentans]GAF05208.1 hypothetical protein JCM21142_93935 [Saccharicrinis fermentans DSM 9555 = JCM 21142]